MNAASVTVRTFAYRLYPTPAQEKRMVRVSEVCRSWYNMCLAERKWAWELEQRRVTKGEQQKTAIRYRSAFPQAKVVFSQTLQSVCDDLDKAFQAFFRRVKSGEKAGYPRFKGKGRWHSFLFKQYGVGAKIEGRCLRLFGIGR
jgi:putative transposase